jgi:patatin-related protein
MTPDLAHPEPPDPSERSREVRLGIVMFGGISLSVYINGVSNELFRAARGRGVYRLLKALTDSHIVVDIMSGASAGGINSVLLSTALANGSEFGTTGTLWRDHADIEELLKQGPDDPKIDNSVLNGGYHQHQLELALNALTEGPAATAGAAGNKAEDPSPKGEIDLFITGTDIDGRITYRADALGHRIQLEDHRVLFQLKHRPGRKEPFSKRAALSGVQSSYDSAEVRRANVTALATLSHITSCFPGAFVPVVVTAPAQQRNHAQTTPAQPAALSGCEQLQREVDGRLTLWGRLAVQGNARQVTLMDGGVLKNKPFTSTIAAIFTRLADTQVSRYMLYVEPVPDTPPATESPSSTRASAPNAPQVPAPRHLLPVALAAASVLPRFESIDADLASVDAHNEQVLSYESLVNVATEAAMKLPPELRASHDTPAGKAYQRARLAGLAAAVERALFEVHPTPVNATPGEDPRLVGLTRLIEQLSAHPSLRELYLELDVLFRFRRLVGLTYAVDDAADVALQAPRVPGEPHARRKRRIAFSVPGGERSFYVDRELVTTLNRQIELYEIVRSSIEQALGDLVSGGAALDLGHPDSWRQIAEQARAVLSSLPWPKCFEPGFRIDALDQCLTADELKALGRSRDVVAGAPLEAPPSAFGFLAAADLFEQKLLAHFPELSELSELYRRFELVDEAVYPVELISRLQGRDLIRTVRISPLDATRELAGRFPNKLCGVQLASFGAFFKRSWRSNDLMWGRIDGAAQLIDLLLDPQRIARAQPVLQANLAAIDLAEIFPHSSAADRGALQNWLDKISTAPAAGVGRPAVHISKELRDRWARASQLEILAEELPTVLKHALEEAAADDKAPLQELAKDIDRRTPEEIGAAIDKHFTPERYTISEQKLPASMPREDILNILTTGGEHFKDALAKSIPEPSGLVGSLARSAYDPLMKAAISLAAKHWVDAQQPPKPNRR